jgi:hypothetical protein
LIIRDLGSASRRKVLAQDTAAMMRVLVMALVLNEQEPFLPEIMGSSEQGTRSSG